MKHPIATILTARGSMRFELFPDCAPNTVNSFIYAAKAGLFQDRLIKRIVPGYVIEPSYTHFDDERCHYHLQGEMEKNGFPNPLPMKRGTLGLGGSGGNTVSGTDIFIVLSDEAGKKLQGRYPAFGQLLEGEEELRRLESVDTKRIDAGGGVEVNEPLNEERISVFVETFGLDYPEPETVEGGLPKA